MILYWDHGLFVTSGRLALDVTRRQPCGFISHAHADHIAPHELALCTPATARLYHHRRGRHRAVREMAWGDSIAFAGCQLSVHPAGHILGSAMLLVDDGVERLLYTGDFKLGESATAERASLPPADLLVIESTFGDPRYRLPPRQQVIDDFLQAVRDSLHDGETPIVHAYVLGKAQEVTRLLLHAGIPVQQHPDVYAISRIYEALGCRLGTYECFAGTAAPGAVIIMPPRSQRQRVVANAPAGDGPTRGSNPRVRRFALTGWALRPDCARRLDVDHVFPLSDHADFDELVAAIEQVQPRRIYCTHGQASFVNCLRQQGWQADFLGPR